MDHGENPNFFAGPYIDRRTDAREDAAWHAAAASDPATRYVIARGTTQLVRTAPAPHIAFLTADDPLVAQAEERAARSPRLVSRRALRARGARRNRHARGPAGHAL
jgi:hypothetical protein